MLSETERKDLIWHLRYHHGYLEDEPGGESYEKGVSGFTSSLDNFGDTDLIACHDQDHGDYPNTGCPVKGWAHKHKSPIKPKTLSPQPRLQDPVLKDIQKEVLLELPSSPEYPALAHRVKLQRHTKHISHCSYIGTHELPGYLASWIAIRCEACFSGPKPGHKIFDSPDTNPPTYGEYPSWGLRWQVPL